MCQSSNFEEFYIFVVWEKAAKLNGIIREDLSKKFEVIKFGQGRWSKRLVHANFLRFYSELGVGTSDKVKEVGGGVFSYYIVKDHAPNYSYRKDASGRLKKVNTNIIDSKIKFRKLVDVNYGVHCSDSKGEFIHNCAMILGSDFQNEIFKQEGKDNTRILNAVAVGENGWENFEELFSYLNLTTKYVVLRNPQELAEGFEHDKGDVDLLCEDRKKLMSLANGIPIWESENFYHVTVGGKKVLFDVRERGENYMDERWIDNILNNASNESVSFLFSPNKEDYFFSHLYYALVNKEVFPEKYHLRLQSIAAEIGVEEFLVDNDRIDNSKALSLLKGYLLANNYLFQYPTDSSVYLNVKNLKEIFPQNRFFPFVESRRKLASKYCYYFRRVKRKIKSSKKIYTLYFSFRRLLS